MVEMKIVADSQVYEELNESPHFMFFQLNPDDGFFRVILDPPFRSLDVDFRKSRPCPSMLKVEMQEASDCAHCLWTGLDNHFVQKQSRELFGPQQRIPYRFSSNAFNNSACHFHGPSWDSGNGYINTVLHCKFNSDDSAKCRAPNSLYLHVWSFSGEKSGDFLFKGLLRRD
jgi:hypothetical protein